MTSGDIMRKREKVSEHDALHLVNYMTSRQESLTAVTLLLLFIYYDYLIIQAGLRRLNMHSFHRCTKPQYFHTGISE